MPRKGFEKPAMACAVLLRGSDPACFFQEEEVLHRIASIEQIQGRSPDRAQGRVRVTMEDGDSFVISSPDASRLGLEEGGELAEEIYAGLFESLRTACMRKCGRLLGSRDYSVKRLREKLCDAGFPAAVIDEAVEKLERAGYLNDIRFAQSYVRSHMRDRSRLRIMRDLAGKGISETVIEDALAAVGEEENIEDAQREQVIRLLKKRGFDNESADYKERQKTMAFLRRKGYPTELIRRLTGGGEDWLNMT